MAEKVLFQIKRQRDRTSDSYWEEFEIPYRPNMNVITALMDIQKNPVNRQGKKVAPVAWDSNCLEEVCGACTMLVNGMVRQSCAALIDQLERPVKLEPMTKFPVVRDLVVDRARIFVDFKRVRAWIPIDGTYNLGPGPRMSKEEADVRYSLSRCMACGCCMEACPNYNEHSSFIGPAAISQALLFNLHPTGALNQDERIAAVVSEGGVQCCGNAQNCVEVCPKEIPLTSSIGYIGRQATAYMFRRWFRR